jgi:protocatechuate 3,4-dioxygenase beta subunit
MDINLTRREALAAATATGAAAVVGGGLLAGEGAGEALAAASCVMTPELTIGPYFVEEKLNRSDVRAGQDGVATTLTMTVFDYSTDCAPVSGALVDIWHCNALGKYSDEAQNNTAGEKWLRGFQTSGTDGRVVFTTIFPGYYKDRTTHIHVRVRVNDVDFTTQIFFTEDQTAAVNQTAPYAGNNSNGTRLKNDGDMIYKQGGANVLLVTLSGTPADGFTGELSLGIDPGGGTVTPTPTPTVAPTDMRVDAALNRVKVVRRKGGARRLRLKITPAERIAIAAKLTRHGNQLAHLFGELGAGAQTVNVKIPRRVKPGPAKLKLTFTDEAGNVRHLHRAVHIPRKHA